MLTQLAGAGYNLSNTSWLGCTSWQQHVCKRLPCRLGRAHFACLAGKGNRGLAELMSLSTKKET